METAPSVGLAVPRFSVEKAKADMARHQQVQIQVGLLANGPIAVERHVLRLVIRRRNRLLPRAQRSRSDVLS
jgi:hypothetical protein